jgi:prepilin-type N-terminal cleavage/methylation domain-containing protein
MKQGFTLIELSIVLVIIGLIVGGVTVGQDLIRSAEINAVISESNQYKTAINAFKLKYNKLPGDMENAQTYWPACTDNVFNTCNGSGNGIIESDFNNFHEGIRFWEHLARAEIISGTFDSSPSGMMPGYKGFITGGYDYLPGSKYEGARWIVGNLSGTGAEVVNNGTQALTLFRNNSSAFLTQPDAFTIDSKIDDGRPYSGKVLGVQWYSASTLYVSSSEYALNRNDAACGILFEF